MKPKIVFMGSPEFSLPTLRALAEQYLIVGVVTQPDKPAGRGQVLTPPPVRCLAQELGLAVIQPVKLRLPEAMEQLRAWAPELIVVAAFGQILRPEVLDLPQFGCINVHASLLPRWRGAAPIQAALLAGDSQTGITIMLMDPGVDTGPMLSQGIVPIRLEDNAMTLGKRLAEEGARLLVETLPGFIKGEIQPQLQNGELATKAPLLKKEDGLLDFAQPAEALTRKVRAYNPWPGAFFRWKDQLIKVHRAHAVLIPVSTPASPCQPMTGQPMTGQPMTGQPMPGQPLAMEHKPALQTGVGILVLDELQPAGKKPMPGEVFLIGARKWSDRE